MSSVSILETKVSNIQRNGKSGVRKWKNFACERENKGVVRLKTTSTPSRTEPQSNCGSGLNPILLQHKYARIVKLFAEQTGLTYEEALDFFYNSKTFELISEGVADMHCLSDEYLAEELLLERSKQH